MKITLTRKAKQEETWPRKVQPTAVDKVGDKGSKLKL